MCLPLAPAEAGALDSLRVVPVRGPTMGLSLAGPSGVGLGLRALRCFACMDPVTDASGLRRTPRPGLVRVCVCGLSWPGRAGWPPQRVLVRLTFACGRFCCSPLLSPLSARVALLVLFLGFFFPPLLCAPLVSGFPCFPALGALGLGVLWSPPPLSFVSLFFSFFFRPLCVFVCFFLFSFSGFRLPLFFFCFFVLWWLCGAGLVCCGLWGVLVCVVVGLVLRRGPVCA